MSALEPSRPIPEADGPALLIDHRCYDRLHALAMSCRPTLPAISERLLHELDRAELLPAGTLPSDVVTVGSLVTYQDLADGSIRSVKLVWPSAADLSRMRISVMTPIGTALIGLREGQQMRWQLQDGEQHCLSVVRVSQTDD